MAEKRPVLMRASWRVLNVPGRSSIIFVAGGGGRRRESTPWITPFVPNWDGLVSFWVRGSDLDWGTYDVDGYDSAVEVYG